MTPKPLIIAGLRGRNGSDSPLFVPDDQCCEALNVSFDGTSLAIRRAGSEAVDLTFSSGGPFINVLMALLCHVPGTDEHAAELWAVDYTGQIGRLAGGVTWVEPTAIEVVAFAPMDVTGVSLGGMFWLTYSTAVNRSYVWDGTSVRRRGFATPAVPTVATNGGSGNTFTRSYRVRWVEIDGSDTVRRSEPSPSADISITNDASVRVTRPAVASEGETHWEVEYTEDSDGPWYRAAQVVIATTTYDDSDATVDDTLTLSDEDGANMPPPAFKYTVKAGAHLLNAGCWQTVAGDSFIPRDNEVYWSPILGAADVGDLERQPPTYRVTLDHPVIGMSEPLNGVTYVFGYRGLSSLVQTDATGEGTFRRITERTDLGCVRHQSIVTADDEFGRQCVYFWSHRGPYRIGPGGMQYLGHDIEDLIATVNLDNTTVVAHGTYYADAHQVYWWIATGDSQYPSVRFRFDTQLGITNGEEVRGGWTVDDGTAAVAIASVSFARTIAASMSALRCPYFSGGTLSIYRADTGTDDDGTDFQAYVDTKEYAPAGLGRNCSLVEPLVIGAADDAALVSVTARTDFGRDTTVSGLISLAPDNTETHVQRKVEGLQTSGIGTARFRIGDQAETDPGFGTLDAFVAFVEDAGPR